jgi:hypothetical protein
MTPHDGRQGCYSTVFRAAMYPRPLHPTQTLMGRLSQASKGCAFQTGSKPRPQRIIYVISHLVSASSAPRTDQSVAYTIGLDEDYAPSSRSDQQVHFLPQNLISFLNAYVAVPDPVAFLVPRSTRRTRQSPGLLVCGTPLARVCVSQAPQSQTRPLRPGDLAAPLLARPTPLFGASLGRNAERHPLTLTYILAV